MENVESKSYVYSHDVIEFVTVAVQYCAYLEHTDNIERRNFVDTMQKMLPLLYLKGALIMKYEPIAEETLPDFVTEENYDIIRNNIACILADKDDFLDVFVEDMKYSESPILCTISENLSDIYQDLKNFVCAFKDGVEETMELALYDCICNYENYWGLKVANTLRALHEVKYNLLEDDIDEDTPY